MDISVMQSHELNMSSLDFLNDYINPSRQEANESSVQYKDFILRVIDETDKSHEEIFLMDSTGGRKRQMVNLSYDDMMLVGMRESKAVRKNVLVKLRELSQPSSTLPASFADALQLAADQARQIEIQNKQLMLDAPKVDFAERIAKVDRGMTLGKFAKAVNLGPRKIFAVLRDMKILISGCQGYNLPMQQYIENGCFVVRQSTYGPENDRIANTTLITGKGELWLTKKLINAGVLKAVAI